jgi:hypothetical protein
VYSGRKPSKSARNPKTVPRKRPKYAKTASFYDAFKSCIRGHKRSKSARNPKSVCYGPRKRPKYAKTASFHDSLKSCIGGHEPSKSARDPKTVPRKRPKYAKTTSFHDGLKSWIGVRNIRNRPVTQKLCAMAQENDQNMRKRRVFTTRSNRVSGVTNGRNRPETLKLCAPTKTAKICENGGFSPRAQIVYRGSRTVEIGPEA